MSLRDDIFQRFAEQIRRSQQSTNDREVANTMLDLGKRVRYVRGYIDVTIERVEGVDFIVNNQGINIIDGSNIIRG